jgi:hypothetical protein
MEAPLGGDLCPPLDEEALSFRAMVLTYVRTSKAQSMKFIKGIEEMLEVKLPQSSTRCKTLAFANRGLIGKFTSIWPSPRTMASWIQKNLKPHVKG